MREFTDFVGLDGPARPWRDGFARKMAQESAYFGYPVRIMYRTAPRFLLLAALCALAAGCLSSRDQVAQRNNERCAARGFQPNTDRFSECLVALDSERDARMESRRRDMMERSNVPPAAMR